MAEKGFGVKEINLIGASGTPTIESPNNLNLNAVNVAISTNVSIGGTLTVSGNISIGGTLTYEDVTNIDSVGIVTARNGLNVSGGNVTIAKDIDVDGHTNLDNVSVAGVVTATTFVGALTGTASKINLTPNNDNTSYRVPFTSANTGSVDLYSDTNSGMTYNPSTGLLYVAGTMEATTFSGSGASLTNLPAANLTGTLPAISGANLTGIAVTEAPVTDYTITANGASAYRFHGGGVNETEDNPDLYLIRGQKYRFNNTTGSGHPFAIREASGGSAYSNGVTGSQNGIQFFTVPYDAPAKIFYQCTIHGGMVGNIYLRGAAGNNTNVGVTTFSSNILTPQQVGCAVRMSNNISHPGNNSFNSGTSWVMPFDTEVWDIGSNFNTSNYTFTAPVAGRYLCCYTIQLESISNWLWNYVYPVVTGTGGNTNTVASAAAGIVFSDDAGNGVTGNSTTTAQYHTFTNTVVMNLTAGQAVRMGIRGNMTATIKGTTETQWTMQLLG